MNILPVGIPLTFSAAFESNPSHVAISVYDDSGASPVILLSPFAMTNFLTNCYRAKVTAPEARSYIVVMAVYTSSAFTTQDSNYLPICKSFKAEFVSSNESLIGLVAESEQITGLVEC